MFSTAPCVWSAGIERVADLLPQKYMENHSFPEFVDHLFRLSAQRIHPAAHDKATASIETLTSAMFDVSEKEPASQDSSPEEPSSPQKRARNEQSGAYGGAPSKIGSFIKSMTYADDNGPASNSELTSPSPTKFFKNPSRSHPPEIVKKHTDDPTDTQASQNRKTHPTDKKKSKSAGHKRRLSETAPDKNDKHDKKHKKRKSEPDPMDPDADH